MLGPAGRVLVAGLVEVARLVLAPVLGSSTKSICSVGDSSDLADDSDDELDSLCERVMEAAVSCSCSWSCSCSSAVGPVPLVAGGWGREFRGGEVERGRSSCCSCSLAIEVDFVEVMLLAGSIESIGGSDF